jgi:hypothetical protein
MGSTVRETAAIAQQGDGPCVSSASDHFSQTDRTIMLHVFDIFQSISDEQGL